MFEVETSNDPAGWYVVYRDEAVSWHEREAHATAFAEQLEARAAAVSVSRLQLTAAWNELRLMKPGVAQLYVRSVELPATAAVPLLTADDEQLVLETVAAMAAAATGERHTPRVMSASKRRRVVKDVQVAVLDTFPGKRLSGTAASLIPLLGELAAVNYAAWGWLQSTCAVRQSHATGDASPTYIDAELTAEELQQLAG